MSTVPGSGRQRPGAPPGGTALPLHGTVTAVGSSSVTIKTSTGTTTYAVTSSSSIEKKGKTTLSALSTGDVVAFSVVTADGTTTIDKLMAGDAPSGMAGGCGPGVRIGRRRRVPVPEPHPKEQPTGAAVEQLGTACPRSMITPGLAPAAMPASRAFAGQRRSGPG